MQYWEIIAICSEIHTYETHKYTIRVKQRINITAVGTNSYHRAL